MTDAIAMLPLGSSLDIAAVAAGTDCTQQNRVINGTWSWVPLAEFDLVTLQTFQASPTHEATTADIVPQNPNLASLDLVNMVAEMNAESVDVYASPMGGAESQLGMTVNPNVSGQVLTLAPGTYSVRVVDHGGGGQLYARSGIVLGAGDRFGVWWIHDSLGHGTLALCNLAPPGSGKLTACTD